MGLAVAAPCPRGGVRKWLSSSRFCTYSDAPAALSETDAHGCCRGCMHHLEGERGLHSGGRSTSLGIGDKSRDWRPITRLVDESRDWSLITCLSIPMVGHECRNAEKSLEGHGTPFRFFRHSGHWSFWILVVWLPLRITRL